MKRLLAMALSLGVLLGLSACGIQKTPAAESVELSLFAASSLTEAMDAIVEAYKTVAPEVRIVATYDSSGKLKTLIENGAVCDLFLSAAPKQMNQLDGNCQAEENPEGLDFINSDSRRNLLENHVTLVVPHGNSKGIAGFEQLAQLLKTGDVLLAVGNSDVPVGQYSQKIFTFYGLDEAALAASGVLTYGSNVKEVTTQVAEASVDCGIVYATDAAFAGLPVVDSATSAQCGQVLYPAALLKGSANATEAATFLEYLSTEPAMAIFEGLGFRGAQ